MNVLFHCSEFPPQPGGVGSYMAHMGAALRAAGHGVVIVTSRVPGLPADEDLPCGRVVRGYDRSEARTPRVRDLVLSLARESRADLLEGADHLGEMAAILRSANRPRVLVKIHGSNPIRIGRNAHALYAWQKASIALALLRNAGQTASERCSIERADLVAAPSQRMLDEVRRQGFRLPARVAVIPNPISPVAEPAGEEAGHPTLLLVGRLDIGKGVQYLPDLLRRLEEKSAPVTLEMAGADSYARGIGSIKEWLSRRLGDQARRVRFLGNLNRDELDRAYARAWAVILPSRWDNFPTVVLEAGVRGKPVVASPNGGMPEMLDGTLCRIARPELPEFADRVGELLADPKARAAAGQSLRAKMLSAYSPKSVVEQYLAFVQS